MVKFGNVSSSGETAKHYIFNIIDRLMQNRSSVYSYIFLDEKLNKVMRYLLIHH